MFSLFSILIIKELSTQPGDFSLSCSVIIQLIIDHLTPHKPNNVSSSTPHTKFSNPFSLNFSRRERERERKRERERERGKTNIMSSKEDDKKSSLDRSLDRVRIFLLDFTLAHSSYFAYLRNARTTAQGKRGRTVRQA